MIRSFSHGLPAAGGAIGFRRPLSGGTRLTGGADAVA